LRTVHQYRSSRSLVLMGKCSGAVNALMVWIYSSFAITRTEYDTINWLARISILQYCFRQVWHRFASCKIFSCVEICSSRLKICFETVRLCTKWAASCEYPS
jgi:hypothetical protein